MSIVGSIGVVGGKVAVGESLEKIGVHTETFSGGSGQCARGKSRGVPVPARGLG